MFRSSKNSVLAKILTGLVLALMVLGPLAQPLQVSAQTEVSNSTSETNPPAAAETPAEPGGCGPGNWWHCFAIVSTKMMQVSAWIAGIVGVSLNYAVQYLIINMGIIASDQHLPAVKDMWVVVRDLVNIFLVFLTIFIGIATILGISGYGYKQLLWKVILAAVFVNFSITLAKFVIDVSNVFTISLYEQILKSDPDSVGYAACLTPPLNASGALDQSINNGAWAKACIDKGIAGVFFSKAMVLTLYDDDAMRKEGLSNMTPDASRLMFYTGVMGTVFFLVLAFVLGAAAFLIVVRFVILLILIMFSPIGLVAWITGVSSIGRQWWHSLINQSFFVSFMFLMWWMSLSMFDGLETGLVGQGGTFQSALSSTVGAQADPATGLPPVAMGALGVVLFFVIQIAFIFASLILAKKMGAYGASAAVRTGEAWGKKAGMVVGAGTGAATLGASAWALRRGIGGAAERMANSETLKSGVSSKNFFVRNAARGVRKATQGTAELSFDARAMTGKDAQKWVGAPKKGGFMEDRKQREKRLKEEAEWTGKAKATSEETRRRDEDVEKVEEKYDNIKNTDVYQKAEQERLKIHETIREVTAQLEVAKTAGNVGAVAQMTKKLDDLSQKSYRVDELRQNMEVGRSLQLEVATGRTVGADGKERALTREEIQIRKEKLSAAKERVSERLGVVDNSVAQLDEQIAKTSDEKMLTALKKQRETIVAYHTKNRELADLAGRISVEDEQKMTVELQRATDELNKMKASESRAVDTRLSDAVRARGDARKDTYINVQSTRREGLTEVPNDRDRAYLMTLRQPQGKDKQYADMQKLFEEWQKNEGASTTPAPESGGSGAGGEAGGGSKT